MIVWMVDRAKWGDERRSQAARGVKVIASPFMQ
jgi:hypothetical protein